MKHGTCRLWLRLPRRQRQVFLVLSSMGSLEHDSDVPHIDILDSHGHSLTFVMDVLKRQCFHI